ncbi:hypothetical protein FRB99_004848, partial [Tulasnella sp. 403]
MLIVRGDGQWNIISTIGTVFNIGNIIYGLIEDHNPTQAEGPYGPYYQYPDVNVQGASFLPRPDNDAPRASAVTFVNNGGRWTNDGHTLPGTLSLE